MSIYLALFWSVSLARDSLWIHLLSTRRPREQSLFCLKIKVLFNSADSLRVGHFELCCDESVLASICIRLFNSYELLSG